MTKKELSQLKHLKSEIEVLKNQIEYTSYKTVTDSVKGSSPYFPYTEHNVMITGVDLNEYNSKVNRIQEKLKRRVEELIDLIDETNDYIENIDDSLIRQILILRYINGFPWRLVAEKIGGNNTEQSVRKAAERYLN